MKKVAILQSNYIPWKGYFDIINSVDEFILYDDMQYTRRDWRNRNQIKTANGLLWLTIPVDSKGKFFQKINETKVTGHKWASEHLRSIQLCYAHAPFYKEYEPMLEELYAKKALRELGRMGITSVLCEGGLKLARSLAEAGLVDHWITIVAPKVIGSRPIGKALCGRINREESFIVCGDAFTAVDFGEK